MTIHLSNGEELRLPTRLEYVKDARQFIDRIMREHNISDRILMKVMLVVDEAVTNAIDHGASNTGEGEVVLTCLVEGEKLHLLVEDFQGKPFDPDYFERIAKSKKWGRGGRGILLINRIMDEVIYVSEKGKSTLLYMTKSLSEEDNP